VLFDFFEPFGLEKRNCELDLAHVGFDLAYLAFQLIEAIAHFEPHFAEQYLEQYKGEISIIDGFSGGRVHASR